MATETFLNKDMSSHASALTYSTILATVPILAIVFAIGRGFGYGTLIEEEIRRHLTMSQEFANTVLEFINSYLAHTQNGIFLGVGLVLLLYTLIQLTTNIEYTFNTIWGVKKPRSLNRRITDYISVFLLLPILIVVSSGLSIFMVTLSRSLPNFLMLDSTLKVIISLSPYILSGLAFTGLYMYMPNTVVRFRHAVLPGLIAGCAFQLLQYFYINSQIWVSSYNAIYGSFAAIPMFMLWVQISWFICLYGAGLSYANQNVDNYSYAKDIDSLSRRYHDFIITLLMSNICKRFEKGMTGYTAQGLATENNIPIQLVNNLLYELTTLRLVIEVYEENNRHPIYLPAEDINRISVNYLLARIDTYGSEHLNLQLYDFSGNWDKLKTLRARYLQGMDEVLLKDL
ncbi:MAG: YihY/virulence factor BrkB family protein [Clostridium sp.]|nr:YihY/virulence factor BrkB family protein [Clostridium sp.]